MRARRLRRKPRRNAPGCAASIRPNADSPITKPEITKKMSTAIQPLRNQASGPVVGNSSQSQCGIRW